MPEKLYIALIIIMALSGIVQAQDTVSQTVNKDSLAVVETPDTLSSTPDSFEADSTKKIEKIEVVRRKFKYREQVGTALGMMAFIALILTTVQSWNPD